MSRTNTIIILPALLLACTDTVPPLRPVAPSSRSLALVAGTTYATNPEDHSLVWTTPGGEPQKLVLGQRPTRVVAHEGRLYVSLRQGRAVVVLDTSTGAPVERARFATGHEPFGLALSPDGGLLYVASSLSDRVDVLDARTGESRAQLVVPGQPRWLALHPSGRHLYVGTLLAGLVVVELATAEARTVPLLAPSRSSSAPLRFGPIPASVVRVTGDPTVSPDGGVLALPVVELNTDAPPGTAYYANAAFTPAVLELELEPEGGSPLDTVPGVHVLPSIRAAAPTSVAYAPQGELLAIVAAGGRELFVTTSGRYRTTPGVFGVIARIDVAGGPEAVLFPDTQRLYVRTLRSPAVHQLSAAGLFDAVALPRDTPTSTLETLEVSRAAPRSWDSGLTPQEDLGRQLFTDAEDPRLSAAGQTCESCHVDGRVDGVTWLRGELRLQTRTLVEATMQRTPLGWTNDRVSMAASVHSTIRQLGGQGLDEPSAEALEAYVATLDPPDLPGRDAPSPERERGREVFGALGCSGCHAGLDLTDRTLHRLGDGPTVSTPSLRGVAATPPYLSNGSLRTLEDVLQAAPGLGKGPTDQLSPEDRAALLAYLRTL
jgi:DNA-binding beta-propeller fold protein YncE/mono/diheme cytochrome c family protein